MREIDERYQHIEALKSLGKRDSESAILAEIKDRLDELRKIEKMIKELGQ
jgi:t-SNARE complex subunit (syntaxin)